jgi:hypothetical protein
LAQLSAWAEGGDTEAAWAYAHYLVDLFDYALFMADENARALLAAETHSPQGHGDALTDQVLDSLLVATDRVARLDALHTGAQAARILLTSDRHPPTARAQLFARMASLKGVARGGGPLAANALARLVTFCDRALRDAVEAPAAARATYLSYCLYPLYDSDPEPYFADDPARRPPEPAWADLDTSLRHLTGTLASTHSRIAPVAARLEGEVHALMAKKGAALPPRRDPVQMGAPLVTHGEPYQATPLLIVGHEASSGSIEPLVAEIEPLLEQDGRGRVALFAPAKAQASALLQGAHAALEAGATVVEVVIGYEQQLKPPPGDYLSGRTENGRVIRLGVLPLALGPMAPESSRPTSRATPRAQGWDPLRATLRLHLAVSPTKWQLMAPSGSFPAISLEPGPGKSDAKNALRAQLERLRAAFPDEDGLVLVPDPATPMSHVAQAAEAARYNEKGGPLFSALALSPAAPKPSPKGDLPERVTRRSAAKVVVLPEILADKASAVRRCYLDALDRSPKLKGTLELSLPPPQTGGPRDPKVVSGPGEVGLRQCVLDRLGPTMRSAPILTARVELSQ